MRPHEFCSFESRAGRIGRAGAGRPASPRRAATWAALLIPSLMSAWAGVTRADTTPLTMLDPNLQVTTVLGAGLNQPIGIVFLGSRTTTSCSRRPRARSSG